MVTRDTAWPQGTPCWVDLGTDDVAAARAFYSGLFGWDIQVGPAQAGGYGICQLGGRSVAGIGRRTSPRQPVAWTTYLAVDDADAMAARAREAGGEVLSEPFDVMTAGRMAVVADPGGAAFGLWQAREHTGMELAGEPGSVCWNENLSRDFEAGKAFYRQVFGYGVTDMSTEDMSYATLDIDGRPVGGIGAMGPGSLQDPPAFWGVYFAAADAEAVTARVLDLGGSVIAPPWDTPYGRTATVADDQGAAFSVMTLASQAG